MIKRTCTSLSSLNPLARLLLLCLFLGCSGGLPTGPVRLLLDGNDAPDVLVERRVIAWPPALEGNRFLTGWFPGRGGGGRALLPPVDGGSARLEIVNVEQKDENLVLDFGDSPQGTVNARAGAQDLGILSLKNPLEIPLPFSKLPLGRVLVTLTFQAPRVAVLAAAVRAASERGEVRTGGSNLCQEGPSIADLVRPVTGGEVLVGSFGREDGTAESSAWRRLRTSKEESTPPPRAALS